MSFFKRVLARGAALALAASPVEAATWILPSSARAPGAGGAFYSTGLTVSNTGATEASFTLKFLGHDTDGRDGAEKTFSLAAGRSATYADVLGSVFGLSGTYGAVRISSDSGAIAVTSQTSTPAPGGGTFGQSVPAFAEADLVRAGEARTILAVREDASFRTNLVLANATDAALDVDASLVAEDGALLGTRRVPLPPAGMTQVSRVVRELGVPAAVAGARLVLSTPTAGGAFAAYAAVIDAATNDPRTLLPVPAANAPGVAADCGFVNASGAYARASLRTVASVQSGTLLVDASRGGRRIPVKVWYPSDAPPARLPVVVFSHGGGPNPNGHTSYAEWGTTFAATGYVSIHLAHDAGDLAAICTKYGIGAGECAGLSPLQVDRPLDASFVLARLAEIEAAFPELAGRLDAARVAVAGHSFGSYTVTSTAGAKVNLSAAVPSARGLSFSDPRPKAFLALSPQGVGRFGWEADSWDPIARPYMSITGSCDTSAGEQAVDRLDPFRYAPAGDVHLAYVLGGFHETFGMNGLGSPDFLRPDLVPFIRMAAVAFLDAYVKGCPVAKAWLRSAGLTAASGGRASLHWKLQDGENVAVPVQACSP